MTALGYGYDSVGLRIRLRRLMETYPSACRDICVSWLSYLSQLIELLASADKIRSDAVKNASRCSICYVPTQQKMRPDVVQDASGRNFSFMKTAA